MTKTVTVEAKGIRSLLQCAILLLAVAAMVAAMAVSTAAPAFAHTGTGAAFYCTRGTEAVFVGSAEKQDLVKQGFTCTKVNKRR